MMLRVNNEFLDFDDVVEVEKQIKLLESLDTSDGDFSYQFSLPKTINNLRILGNPQPDNLNKQVYQRISTDLLNDSGAELFKGYIRVERLYSMIDCSFFAGNNNWFGLLADSLRALNWSEYDTELSQATISAAIFSKEGVVFPLLDNGALVSRGTAQLKVEDFVAGIYVKTVFAKIFQSHGIKIQGELLNSTDFDSAITIKNGADETLIDGASVFAGKTSTTARGIENDDYKITFDTVSVYPYYMGAIAPFDLGTDTFTAPFKMTMDIEVVLQPQIVDASYNNRIYLYINGVFTFVDIGLQSGAGGLYNSSTAGDNDFFKITRTITLEAGDTMEVYSDWQQSSGSTPNDVISGSLKITPKFIYSITGAAIVPDWTQQEYVSAVMELFNVIPSYNSGTKTLTLNLFEKVGTKPAIDLSEHISETEVDYVEFVSSYGKSNLLTMVELEESDEFRALNLQRLPYRNGVISVDNEFLEDSVTVVEGKFVSPITYINPAFDMCMQKTDLVAISEEGSTNFTSVTAGTLNRPRITVEDNIFLQSDIIRIRQSTNPEYNGDWLVIAVDATSNWIEIYGVPFNTDATGEGLRMVYEYGGTDNVFILHQVPLYPVSGVSSLTSFRLEVTDYSTIATAFSRLMQMNRQINHDFLEAMHFDGGDYQRSLTDKYFRLITRVLNDPVKLYCTVHLPLAVYHNLDMLSPVHILTEETQNRYYINRISGYKESHLPAMVELIKIP